jgi:hypothetical protein
MRSCLDARRLIVDNQRLFLLTEPESRSARYGVPGAACKEGVTDEG